MPVYFLFFCAAVTYLSWGQGKGLPDIFHCSVSVAHGSMLTKSATILEVLDPPHMVLAGGGGRSGCSSGMSRDCLMSVLVREAAKRQHCHLPWEQGPSFDAEVKPERKWRKWPFLSTPPPMCPGLSNSLADKLAFLAWL